jgi:hypothetical protein
MISQSNGSQNLRAGIGVRETWGGWSGWENRASHIKANPPSPRIARSPSVGEFDPPPPRTIGK